MFHNGDRDDRPNHQAWDHNQLKHKQPNQQSLLLLVTSYVQLLSTRDRTLGKSWTGMVLQYNFNPINSPSNVRHPSIFYVAHEPVEIRLSFACRYFAANYEHCCIRNF